MVNDKTHLYGLEDANKDRKNTEKRRDQQQFSRFSIAVSSALNTAGLEPKAPATQIDTKVQIGDPYDDTKGSVGASTQTVNFDIYGSNYTFYEVTGDVNFVFNELPTGRHITFTLDILVNQVAGVTIGFPGVTNPPVLAGNDGDRYVLEFIAVNRTDPTGVNPPVQTITFLGEGTSGVSFPLTPDISAKGNVTGAVDIDLSAITAHYQEMILIGNITFTFSNPPVDNKEISFLIDMTQDATGGRTVTWPASVRVDPTVGSGANDRTIVIVTTVDNGTNYDALIVTGGTVNAANKQLSNLGTTSINADLDPSIAGVRNFGNASLFWNKLFIEEIIFPDTQGLTDITDPTIGYDSGLTPSALYLNAPSGNEISHRIAGTRIFAVDALQVIMYFGGFEEFKFTQDRFEMNGGDIFEIGAINFNTTISLSDTDLNSITSTLGSGIDITIVNALDTFDVFVGGDKLFFVSDSNTQFLSGSPNTLSAAIRLFRDDPSPVANDAIGSIHFDGKDLVPGFREYATIVAGIENTGVGVTQGSLDFRVTENGVPQQYIKMNTGGTNTIEFTRTTNFGTNFLDIGEITTPVNPLANVGRFYVKDLATVTTLFFRDSAGTETNLLVGGGVNKQLSNLSGIIAVNLDLLPNQATGGNLGSSTATEEWFNLYTGRVQFPQFITAVTTIPSIQWVNLAIDEFRFNTPTGDIFGWWVGATQEMELSNTTLKLEGVDLDLDNHNINNIGTTLDWNISGQSIISDTSGLDITTPAGDFVKLSPGTTMTAEFNDFFFRLKNTSLTQTPQIILHMDDSAPGIGDIIGHFFFDGEDSVGTQTSYASINAEIKDPTNTSEDGILRLKVASNGPLVTGFEIQGEVGGSTPLIGFRGVAPQTVKSYSRVTTTTDRAVSDTSTITTQELGNILGTLLKDLSDMGIITGV